MLHEKLKVQDYYRKDKSTYYNLTSEQKCHQMGGFHKILNDQWGELGKNRCLFTTLVSGSKNCLSSDYEMYEWSKSNN